MPDQRPIDRPATMTPDEVSVCLAALDNSPPDHDPYTRLAWRPAWSIRSQKGAWAAFLAMIRDPR